jgi:hypothetical protein
VEGRGVVGWGEWCGLLTQRSPVGGKRGSQVNILKEKIIFYAQKFLTY